MNESATGSGVSVYALLVAFFSETVYLNDVTLNDLSLIIGIVVGVLTASIQIVRLCSLLRNRGSKY